MFINGNCYLALAFVVTVVVLENAPWEQTPPALGLLLWGTDGSVRSGKKG